MTTEGSMTIEFNPEQDQVIGEAIQAGLIQRADQVIEVGLEALRDRLKAAAGPSTVGNADEWMRKFRSWAHSHAMTAPLLSDAAISRQSIYSERGL
jgi:hypothetical protein